MKTRIFPTLIAVLIGATCSAQVQFEVTPRTLPLNRQLSFSIIVEGNPSRNPSFPKGLQSEHFQLLSSSAQTSFSTTIINGKVSSKKEFTYAFRAQKKGTFQFEPQEVNIDGKIYRSQPVSIEVVDAETQIDQGRRRNSIFDDFFQSPFETRRRSSRQPEIFAEMSVPKTTYYVGEAIPVDMHLFFYAVTINPRGSSLDWPTLTDFWIEDVELGDQRMQRVERNGNTYNASLVDRKLLYANRDGKLTIDPAVFDLVVSTGGFMNEQKVRRETKPLELEILPLPQEGQPDFFSGAVGLFELASEVDTSELAVGETLSLKYILSGDGNFSAIQTLDIEALQEHFEVFDGGAPLVEKANGRITKKTWVYALVPKSEGTFEVPPVTFSYFDLTKKDYVTLNTEAKTINVKPGSRLPDQLRTGDATAPDPETREDTSLRFIHFNAEGWKTHSFAHRNPMSLVYLLTALLVGNLLILFTKRARESWMGKREELKPMLAFKEFQSRSKQLRKRASGDDPEFFSDLSSAMMDYFGSKMGRAGQGLLLDEIERYLEERGAPETLYRDLVDCVESCDFARFTPASSTSRDQILQRVQDVVKQAEEVFK